MYKKWNSVVRADLRAVVCARDSGHLHENAGDD